MLLRSTLPRRILPKPYFQQQRRERSGRGHVIEIDLQGDGAKKVEEMIHRMDVLKSTPEWLPFLPGSSFWVPPPSSPSRNTLAQDESLSLTTFHGWPSSHFFQDNVAKHSSSADAKVMEEVDVVVELRSVEAEVEVETEAEVEVEGNATTVGETQVLTNSGKTSKS